MADDASERLRRRQLAGRAMSLGTNLMGGMLVFGLGGYWLDRRHGGGYAWTLVGVFLAFVYGGYEVWKIVSEMRRAEEDAETEDQDQ